MKLEVQLLNNLRAYTRPQTIELDAAAIQETQTYRLFPGWDGEPSREVVLYLVPQGLVHPDWLSLAVQVTLDRMPLSQATRPGLVYVESGDVISGLVHFGSPAPDDHPTFGGWWTLTLRAV